MRTDSVQDSKPNTLLYKVLFLLAFTACYFVCRIPLIHEPLFFEEGIFAELMVHQPVGPHYNMYGRIDGQNVYARMSHPAGPYEVLRLAGKLGHVFLADPLYVYDDIITPRLRILSVLISWCAWMTIALWGCLVAKNRWACLVIAVAGISPLAMKTSTALQIDNTAGVLICGIAAVLIYQAFRCSGKGWLPYCLCAGAGCIVGLGKQEWSIALLAAIAAGLLFVRPQHREVSVRDELRFGFSMVAGLLLGNAISFIYDPENYVSAFYMMKGLSRFSANATGNLLDSLECRIPFLVSYCLLAMLMGLYMFSGRPKSFSDRTLFFYGNFLFLPFLASQSYELRYFAPALVVITVGCMGSIPFVVSFRQRVATLAVAGLILMSSGVFLYGYTPDRNIQLEMIQQGTLKSEPGTLLFVNSGAGWNKPHIDYIGDTIGIQSAYKVAERNGKKLLIPPSPNQSEQ